MCVVNGPHEPSTRSTTKANINVEFTIAAFSETDRKKRNRTDRRIQEYSMAIQKAFDIAVLTSLIPRSQIDVKVHVLSQDGGLLQSVINAATLALVDAGVPMTDYVCACNAGCLQDDVLLDLNNIEENDLSWCTVATLGKSGQVTLLQMENKVQMERFETIMAVAISGCEQIHTIMDDTVRRTSKGFLEKLKVR
ncbi:Exosome complex component ski6 [Neolecta irregularis DAH-3]|uniref:Ribosomal RNA-processing protein 41 n=1 Tax=Neolecta irregularis (strain DAH-3) TaxID=1198029 RepID=A0A1U7LLV1_NEOID|nr:Exosome complex component ski6 [Neolecta irregularis DAH-3]|eukprot:OLL23522.1 Exosome complex component ski6 [Neolecta irregularis DAH-3]